jgi:hypothetical protein
MIINTEIIIFDKNRVQVHGLWEQYKIIMTTMHQESAVVVLFYIISLVRVSFISHFTAVAGILFYIFSFFPICKDLMDQLLREIGNAQNVRM